MPTKTKTAIHSRRNGDVFDLWSIIHMCSGILMGWLMDPFTALVIMILWEPLEIFVLSPLLWNKFKIVFGFESLRNSLSDIVFDAIGVTIGAYLLTGLIDPPLHLF